MDLDSFILRHGPQWDRLTELTQRRGRLTGAEADEVVDLYQRVSTHLSVVRSTASDPVLEARLSALVAGARALVTGVSVPYWQVIGHFFTAGLPAALYRARYWWISVGVACIAVAIVVAYRVVSVPGLAESLLDDDEVKQLVEHDFANYYSENPAADFALSVWLNNALVSATCLILGVLIIPTLIVLWQNMANLGVIAAFMVDAGRADVFYGLILPHGMLELTIVFVGAGAGLRIGWAWIAPGLRTRSAALASEGRAAGAIALGMAVWLLVSGILEGFVTPSTLPAWARVSIGAVLWLAFLAYVFVLGRRAARAGETGDLSSEELEATVPFEAA